MSDESFYLKNQMQRASFDADQTEFVAIKNGQATTMAGLQDDIIADSMDDFGFSNEEIRSAEWQIYQNKVDNGTERIIRELQSRTELLGDLYPFKLVDNSLEYVPINSDNKLYEFLLCATLSSNLSKGKFAKIPRYFERLSAQISASYLGNNTQYQHIGWPRRPSRFKDAMALVKRNSGEWDWTPALGLPDSGPRSGDEGVDFVVWKSFSCGRQLGNLFLLGQCACGNDWNDKFNDIGHRFTKWFGSGPLVKPVNILSVPHVISEPWLREASREAGLVFDRVRIVKIAELGGHYEHGVWINVFEEIISLVVS